MTAIANPAMPVVEYSVSDAAIEKLAETFGGLTAETPAKYEQVRRGIAQCRDLRVAVEAKRKELKADSIAYGKAVDAEAKRITALLVGIEEPLKLTKQAVDDEKARIKREKEEAARAKIEAEIKAKREAEEAEAARIRAMRDAAEKAERDRIAAEQAAEAARLAEERKALEAERAAAEEKLAKERAAIEAERQRIEREEFERQAKERAEREAKEKAAKEAAEAKAAAERAAAERKRLATMAPDKDKLAAMRSEINLIEPPAVISPEAKACLKAVYDLLNEAIEALDAFCVH